MLGLGRYRLKAATARLAEGSPSSTAEKETLTYDSEIDLRGGLPFLLGLSCIMAY